MPPTDRPSPSESQPPTGSERATKSAPNPAQAAPEQQTFADLVVITVDPTGGRVVKVEHLGHGGERHELSKKEAGGLTAGGAETTVQRLLEQAFQAGIDCVLGDDAEEAEQESAQDAELSRALLRSLIERSAVTRLMKSEVLDRAIIGTLIGRAAVGRATPGRNATTN